MLCWVHFVTLFSVMFFKFFYFGCVLYLLKVNSWKIYAYNIYISVTIHINKVQNVNSGGRANCEKYESAKFL